MTRWRPGAHPSALASWPQPSALRRPRTSKSFSTTTTRPGERATGASDARPPATPAAPPATRDTLARSPTPISALALPLAPCAPACSARGHSICTLSRESPTRFLNAHAARASHQVRSWGIPTVLSFVGRRSRLNNASRTQKTASRACTSTYGASELIGAPRRRPLTTRRNVYPGEDVCGPARATPSRPPTSCGRSRRGPRCVLGAGNLKALGC